MQDSIFTKIIKREVPCHKIYEDSTVIAFLDVHPQVEGHTLVVPKQQVDHLWDLDEESYAHLWSVARKLARHMRDRVPQPRIGAVVAGYGVPHAHIHLIPMANEADLKKPQDIDSPINHDALARVAEILRFDD